MASPTRAAEYLVDLPEFRAASLAYAEADYEGSVAAHLEVLDLLEGLEPGSVERDLLVSRLLESWVRAGRPGEAVAWIDARPVAALSPSVLRWIALAKQATGRYSRAALAYAELAAAQPGGLERPLALNRAEVLAKVGDEAGAMALCEALSPPQGEGDSLVFARVAMLCDEPEACLAWLLPSDREERRPEAESDEALALATWARQRAGEGREALDRLLSAITGGASETEAVSTAVATDPAPAREHGRFLLLEALLGTEPGLAEDPEVAAALDSLAAADPEGLAGLFAAIMDGGGETAVALERWAERDDRAALAAEARFRLGLPLPSPALEGRALLPDGFAARAAFAEARRKLDAGEFEQAAERFESLAEALGESTLRRQAWHNAAVAAIGHGDSERFDRAFAELAESGAGAGRIGSLELAAALSLASREAPRATERLHEFLRDRPEHPAAPDAALALMEIYLNQVPARIQSAADLRERIEDRPLSLEHAERLDYLAVWSEILSDQAEGLAERAESFLRDWPGSRYRDEIAMALARHHYLAGRHEAALARFRSLLEESPASEFAHLAAFFAAKCSPQGEARLSAWRQLVEGGESPFQARAMHEMALQFLLLDRFPEARQLLRDLSESEDADSSLRFAALADLAYSHHLEALALGSDPAALELASEAYASLSAMATAPEALRFSAAVRRAKCLELLGRQAVALEIYRSLFAEPAAAESFVQQAPDTGALEWVYRAGFAAIRLQLEEEDWSAAIRTADILSRKEGPRSLEAARLAELLRLEHWVWD